MLPKNKIPSPFKLTFQDWLLAIISVTFTIAGLFILPDDKDVGIVTIALFGACTAVAINNLFRKKRLQRLQPSHIDVIGGVPIRPSRMKLMGMGISLLLLGVILVLYGYNYGAIFQAISYFIAVVGLGIVIAVIFRFLPVAYLQFDPQGIIFGSRRWQTLIPWTAISHMTLAELHSNPAIFLWIDNHDEIIVQPPSYRVKVMKQIALTQSWQDADFVVLPSIYNIDAPILFNAIERYVTQPIARDELAQHRIKQD